MFWMMNISVGYMQELKKNGDDVYVIDLNSTNGTFINGERLQANERRRLQPLDEVAFASIIYEYETEQQ